MVSWHKHISDSLFTVLKIAREDSNKVDLLHGIGFNYNRLAEYEKAIKYLDLSLSLSQKLNLKKREAREYSYLGSVYGDMGNYTEALKNHQAALKIQEEDNNIKGAGTSYNEIANIYDLQGKYTEALQYLFAAMKNWNQTGNLDGIAFLLQNIASIYQKQGKYEEALQNYSTALEHWKKGTEIFDSIYVSEIFGDIGNVYFDQGNYQDALKFYSNALTIAQKIKKGVAMINAYNHLGNLSNAQGDYPEALKNYFKALDIAERTKNKNAIPEIRNNIGSIYVKQNNFQEALNNYLISLKIREELADKGSIIRIYVNIGKLYLTQEKIESAFENLFLALKYSQETGDKQGLILSYNTIGRIYFKKAAVYMGKSQSVDSILKNLSLAERHQTSALKISEETGEKSEMANAYINLGNTFSKQAKYINGLLSKQKQKDAIQYLSKGLLLAKQIGIKEDIKDSYLILGENYKITGNYKKALEYTNLYLAMKDSLYNTESSRKMETLRTEYEVEKAVAKERIEKEKLALEEKGKNENKFSDEKIIQQQITADEKARHEKAELEENFRHQTAMAEEQTHREQLLLKQKLTDEKTLAVEKANQEKLEIEERERHQIALYEEKMRHEKVVFEEKQKQDKLLAEKERRNNRMLTGVALIFITGIFMILLIRQRNQRKIAVERANAIHKMAELEMQSLRTQLNPHFMFNSLNSIQELILLEENEKSHSYLARFGKLLRMLLENAEKPFIPLRKEIDFLQLYLALENLRIPDLQYSVSTDPKLNPDETFIPNMILQPYIENAIWHGLSHKEKDKQLQIRIYRENGTVNYEIEDNGVGRIKSAELKSLFRQKHQSKGMELLTKRFKLLNEEYNSDIYTNITDVVKDHETVGTLVTIKVPLKLSETFTKLKYDTNNNN